MRSAASSSPASAAATAARTAARPLLDSSPGISWTPTRRSSGITTWPNLGLTQQLDVTQAPAGLAFAMYGWSTTAIANLRLPLSLAAFGMPGCELLQSLDVTVPCASTSAASARTSLLLPNSTALLGLQLSAQAWAPAPRANAAGVIVSNAVSLFVGNL